jgi:hypothetical protein
MGRGGHGGHGHSHGGDVMEGANVFTKRLIYAFLIVFACTIWYTLFVATALPSPRPLADFDYCEAKNAELVRQMKLYEAQIDDLRAQLLAAKKV